MNSKLTKSVNTSFKYQTPVRNENNSQADFSIDIKNVKVDDGIYRTKSGSVKIEDMSDDHLTNANVAMYRKLQKQENVLTSALIQAKTALHKYIVMLEIVNSIGDEIDRRTDEIERGLESAEYNRLVTDKEI